MSSSKGTPEEDILHAAGALQAAIELLEDRKHNRHDLRTCSFPFLGILGKDQSSRQKVVRLLQSNSLASLSLLGARTPERLSSLFGRAELECPLAFVQFNAAYQHELGLVKLSPQAPFGSFVRTRPQPLHNCRA